MDERHQDILDCGGALTTAIATPLGSLCAYGLHCSTPRIRSTAQILVIMPIVVPVILIAVGVFSLYAKLGLNYTLTGIVIAHTALALPFVIVTVMSGLQNYDFDQELAAAQPWGFAGLRVVDSDRTASQILNPDRCVSGLHHIAG